MDNHEVADVAVCGQAQIEPQNLTHTNILKKAETVMLKRRLKMSVQRLHSSHMKAT